MKNGIRAWKILAASSLKGQYKLPIVATLLLFLANVFGGDITLQLFPGSDVLSIIASQIFAFVLSLLITLFTTGVGYMYLNIAREKKASANDFIFFFRNQPDRILFAAFVLALIDYVVTIPASYYGFVSSAGTTMETLRVWMTNIMLLSGLAVLLDFVLTLPFKMTFYLLADYPEMGSKEALLTSCKMMRHHLGSYLLMELSFVPWLIFSVYLTFGIGLLWLIPYMKMTEVFFYRNLKGELDGYFTDHNERTAGEQVAGGSSGQVD